MGLGIGDNIMASKDRPGENGSVKKGMKGIIVAEDKGWSSYCWEVSWDEGKHKDRIKGENSDPGVTKI
jgi:hypothetical protein